MERRYHTSLLKIVEGDITEQQVDAIVNAANSKLAHVGGVARAIVKKGGKIIQEESNTWVFARGEVKVGHVAITCAGSLPARYVIHAVGPRMGEGSEDKKLMESIYASLMLAEKHKLKSIAFPAISTGIFGFPVERCALITLTTLIKYLQGKTGLETVVVCLFGKEAYQVFEEFFQRVEQESQ